MYHTLKDIADLYSSMYIVPANSFIPSTERNPYIILITSLLASCKLCV